MTDTPTPGQVNYEAYMAHMPVRAAYASLHTSTRRAWEAAAQAVLAMQKEEPAPAHTYPSLYPPGTHWAFDEAWAILDTLDPGVLSPDQRSYLSGLMAGTLTRVTHHGPPPLAAAQAVLTQAGLLVLDLDPEEERTDA